MQIKLIFIRKDVHLASFWKWGFLEHGRGLWLVNREGVFERCTSTGSDAFSFIIWLHAYKFVLLSVFTLIETIWPKIWAKTLPMYEKDPLPVDARRSNTSLLKLSGNDPRSNCGTHLGTSPLIVSKMTNSFCAALQMFLFWEGNSDNEWIFCECSLVLLWLTCYCAVLVVLLHVHRFAVQSHGYLFLRCGTFKCCLSFYAIVCCVHIPTCTESTHLSLSNKTAQAFQWYTYLIAKMVLWRAQIPFFCRWTAVSDLNSLFQILEFFK